MVTSVESFILSYKSWLFIMFEKLFHDYITNLQNRDLSIDVQLCMGIIFGLIVVIKAFVFDYLYFTACQENR